MLEGLSQRRADLRPFGEFVVPSCGCSLSQHARIYILIINLFIMYLCTYMSSPEIKLHYETEYQPTTRGCCSMQEEQEFSRLNAFKLVPTYLHLHMGTNGGMGQVTGVNLSYVE